mgnify:CR=1 FL=1
MPATFDLILKNGKCFIDGELRTIDIGISNGIIKSIDKIEKTSDASWSDSLGGVVTVLRQHITGISFGRGVALGSSMSAFYHGSG